jgi:hypothetical protein
MRREIEDPRRALTLRAAPELSSDPKYDEEVIRDNAVRLLHTVSSGAR